MNLEELIQKFLFSAPEHESKESDQKPAGEDKEIKNESTFYERSYMMGKSLWASVWVVNILLNQLKF